jgi:hypothetical protein
MRGGCKLITGLFRKSSSGLRYGDYIITVCGTLFHAVRNFHDKGFMLIDMNKDELYDSYPESALKRIEKGVKIYPDYVIKEIVRNEDVKYELNS